MTHESLFNELWTTTLTRLGGAKAIAALARETKAFVRPREVKSAVDLLRIILAYCLGGMGLRVTSAWAASVGLADLSNVALLGRLRNSTAWMQRLVGVLLAGEGESGLEWSAGASTGRRIRLLDATTVPKASLKARTAGGLWRVHAGFDLPSEQFSFFEVTDEKEAEHLGRMPVEAGDIVIADRGYMSTARLGAALEAGADVIVRAGWRQVRWLDESGAKLDLLAALKAAEASGRIDRKIGLGRTDGKAPDARGDGRGTAPAPLRLVAMRKPPEAAAKSRRTAQHEADKEKVQIAAGTLLTADWMLLVTSLPADTYPAERIVELYRSRWRIEMAFKRLKSVVGLGGPPGQDPAVAKTWILAHLLMVLLLEPHVGALEVSPRQAPRPLAA